MIKKEGAMKTPVKAQHKKEIHKKKKLSKTEVEQLLIDNFINLQKVLTNLSIKFEDLSNNVSKFLQLFEISARSFAEKMDEGGDKTNSDDVLLKKLDSLLDQNKTISKGILLMEEQVRKRQTHPPILRQMPRRNQGYHPERLPERPPERRPPEIGRAHV